MTTVFLYFIISVWGNVVYVTPSDDLANAIQRANSFDQIQLISGPHSMHIT